MCRSGGQNTCLQVDFHIKKPDYEFLKVSDYNPILQKSTKIPSLSVPLKIFAMHIFFEHIFEETASEKENPFSIDYIINIQTCFIKLTAVETRISDHQLIEIIC